MEAPVLELSLYTVKAIIILDNDGERLFAKYYDDTYPSVKEQRSFEKNIFSKTHRSDSEIALLEGLTVVYKSSIDLYCYVIGSAHQNELMLTAVLNCLFDSLSQMLRKNVEKRALLDNMEGLFLAVDEIVDGGVILESDPQQVVHRVAVRGEDVPLTEQTVSQVLQSAKEQIKWSFAALGGDPWTPPGPPKTPTHTPHTPPTCWCPPKPPQHVGAPPNPAWASSVPAPTPGWAGGVWGVWGGLGG
ncbi:coatomer subunit zeta-1 [Pseudopipra pipra]|uniref:coatomer subunit zeta-1 n=1 Tax=Pseudopipra pipra TaxID=415032 RepID=UPI003138DF8F